MPTLRQMIPTTRRVKANSGKEYELPRPSISLRLVIADFGEKAKELEPQVKSGDTQALRELSEAMIDMLEAWLRRTNPDITREEIADEFDVGDIPAFMAAIASFEQEIQDAIPPASRATSPRRRPARK